MVGFAKTVRIRAKAGDGSYMQRRLDYLDYVAAVSGPRVVVVEAMQPLSFDPVRKGPNVGDTSQVWDPVLRGHGYVFATFDGLNRFFNTPLLVGAVTTVVLAVALDLALVGVERWLTPWNRRRATT